MSTLILTAHAVMRMAQRSIRLKDAELIALIGTEVEDGYLVLNKDYREVERQVKEFLDRCRRMIGNRLVIAGGNIVPLIIHQLSIDADCYATRMIPIFRVSSNMGPPQRSGCRTIDKSN